MLLSEALALSAPSGPSAAAGSAGEAGQACSSLPLGRGLESGYPSPSAEEQLGAAVLRAERAEARAEACAARLAAVQRSWSWRLTAPLRRLGGLALGAGRGLGALLAQAQRPLWRLMRAVLARPALADGLNRQLLRWPHLHRQLVGVARGGGLLPPAPAAPSSAASYQPRELPPRARRLQAKLEDAIARRWGTGG